MVGRRGGAVESGSADRAAGITVGTAVAKRSVLALEAALEVDPFALAVGIAEGGGANALASRSASASDVVPHAVRRLAVAGILGGVAERALEDALLSGVEVVADARLLDALSLAGESRAGVEAGRLSGIPDASRVSLAGEETLGFATVDAGGSGFIPAAGKIRLAGSGAEVTTRLLTVTRSTDDAIGISVTFGLLSGTIPAVGTSVLASTIHHLTLRASVTSDDGVQVSTSFSAGLALGIPEAVRISSTLSLVDVLDGAAASAVQVSVSRRTDTLRVGLAFESRQQGAVSAANLIDGIPDGVVERIRKTVIASGITDFGDGNTNSSSWSIEVANNTARITFAFTQEARVTLGDTDHVRRFPNTAIVVDAGGLSRDGLAARLAEFVGGVPSAAVGDGSRLAGGDVRGRSLASLAAGAVGGEPFADTRELVAFSVGGHELAGLLADKLVGVPDAARIGSAVSDGGVGGIATAFADVVAPVAESVQGAVGFVGESVARGEAETLVSNPFAHGIDGAAVSFGGVSELALELTLGVGDVPSAHGIAKAATTVFHEGAVSGAARSGDVPDASRIIVAGHLRIVGVDALLCAGSVVVGSDVTHGVGPAEITDLRPDDGGVLLSGEARASLTAFLASAVPHAVRVSTARG